MNVTDNVGYGLRVAGGVSKGEIRDRVAEALELVKLGGFEDRCPTRCRAASGMLRWREVWRMRRRCCCSMSRCRHLTRKPRAQMQFELVDLQEEVNFCYRDAHDQDEALSMAAG
jgi:spermidine/putrescine transport system ATP-binding protein/putrescine transport system ATP-binding protein